MLADKCENVWTNRFSGYLSHEQAEIFRNFEPWAKSNSHNFSLSLGKVSKIFICPAPFLPVPDRRTVCNFQLPYLDLYIYRYPNVSNDFDLDATWASINRGVIDIVKIDLFTNPPPKKTIILMFDFKPPSP